MDIVGPYIQYNILYLPVKFSYCSIDLDITLSKLIKKTEKYMNKESSLKF